MRSELAAKQVKTVIPSDNGTIFLLPSATYSYSGDFSDIAVRDWIDQIVDGLGYQHDTLVTSGSSAWRLKKA